MLPQDEALSKVDQFCQEFCQDCNTREKWHFRLEVATKKVIAGQVPRTSLATLICNYITYIGHKACCFSDLERWLPMVKGDAESIQILSQFVMSILNVTFFVAKGTDLLQNVQKKVTAIEVCQELDIPVNDEFYVELFRIYSSMIPEYSETLETKEILSLDAIPLLIAKSLHVRANEEMENKVKKMALECEVLSILRKNTNERP